jgi:hypothetical protein
MGKNLADKYSHLSTELDKIVHEANSEIRNLENKVKGTRIMGSRVIWLLIVTTALQIDQKTLRQKNTELSDMYRDKSKKQAQTQHLYDTLKKRVMTSQVQTAASDSVAQAIHSMSSIPRPQTFAEASFQQPHPISFHPDDQRDNVQYQHPHHGRSPSRSSKNARDSAEATAMLPPPGPQIGQHTRTSLSHDRVVALTRSRWLSIEHTAASNPPPRHHPDRSQPIPDPSEHQSSRHRPTTTPRQHHQPSKQPIRIERLWDHSRHENRPAHPIESEQQRAASGPLQR